MGAIALKGGSEDSDERIIIRSKQIFNFLVLSKRDQIVDVAKTKIFEFISETRQKNQLLQKFKKTLFLSNTNFKF